MVSLEAVIPAPPCTPSRTIDTFVTLHKLELYCSLEANYLKW